MQQFIDKVWYQGHWAKYPLLPLSALFAGVASMRRTLFRLGLKKAYHAEIPVIVVGNITAGGSGKTPTVLYLIDLLKEQGYQPGVISRGYGASIEQPLVVTEQHSPTEVGDEPAMIYARTQVPMVVAPKRVAALQTLQQEFPQVDVVICDDGLQHYALARDIELVVIDGQRRFGNQQLLPAGPLREGLWRLAQADFLICNGGQAQANEFLMTLAPSALKPVAQTAVQPPPQKSQAVTAMAGIGNPQRFFDSLQELGWEKVTTHAFDDHQAYTKKVIDCVSDHKPVIMTEKDAVKCRKFAKDDWWYLPVDAKINHQFNQQFLQRLSQVQAKRSR